MALSSGNSSKTDNQYDRPIIATNCDQTIVKLTSSVTCITAKIMTRQW